ncbi:MAG TPA: class I SAM-dependent methyltransferase [Pyrinomonadaceae bacterium]|nr:class I SAM-dependent methyltransferase [Pyrinomonadaceae bacterium]
MDSRTPGQVREHYEIELQIAERLRESTASDRTSLYQLAYDELFERVRHHPLLHNDSNLNNRDRIAKEVAALNRFLTRETIYLEIGPGDCSIAFEVAKKVRKAIAVDVSEIVTGNGERPDNFELIISNGTEVPVPANSVDVIYSNQLMEHLHPEDAALQLRNIFDALRPGGIYFCITPNRLSGPHDISRNFDNVATCLHLHEFTVTELQKLFTDVGFSTLRIYLKFRQFEFLLPLMPFRIAESILDRVPHRLRKMLTFNKVIRFVLGVKLLAEK